VERWEWQVCKGRAVNEHRDDVVETVRCLAGTGGPGPDPGGRRYAVVRFGFDDEGFDTDRDRCLGKGVVHMGEAPSFLDAFELLAAYLAQWLPGDHSFENEEFLGEFLEEHPDLAPVMGMVGLPRRPVVCLLMGCLNGPMDFRFDPDDGFVTDDHDYLGEAPGLLGDARFVFLASAAPPWHDEAYAILRLPSA